MTTGQLFDGKPIIDITLADALPAPAEVDPFSRTAELNLREYRALLDTGADITCVCKHVVTDMGLRSVGYERMIGATGPSLHATYLVGIGIILSQGVDDSNQRGIFQLEPLVAAEIKSNQWFDLIIGTDILANHEFSLTRGGGFRLKLFSD